MRASGDQDTSAVRGRGGKESRDAMTSAFGVDAAVFVKAIDHQDETSPVGSTAFCRSFQCMKEGLVACVLGDRGFLLAKEGIQLALNDLTEGGTIVLTGQAGRDEERDDYSAGWRVENKLSHECGLARPCWCQPAPPQPLSTDALVRGGTEGGHSCKLLLPALKAIRGETSDLVQVAGNCWPYRSQHNIAIDETGVDEPYRPLRPSLTGGLHRHSV
ncbi:hypothetical protein DN402_16900 [Streptomyces sp. SW4]|nr:hypothetical protein DN402_16900 [Streptomyces sp. SW4]